MSSKVTTDTTATLTSEVSQEEGGVLGQVGLNANLFAAQLLNFAIVLFVVVRFVVRPLQAQLSERSARIEEGLRQAQEADARLQKAMADQADVLAQARQEAAGIVSQARVAADTERQKSVERTKDEVARIIAQGKQQLVADKQAMLAEAKGELARVVIAAATQVTAGALDTKAAQAQVAQAVEQAYGKA